MKINLYCYYDTLSNLYGNVKTATKDAEICYSIRQNIKKSEEFKEFWSHTQLCKIGTLDIISGIVTPLEAPIRVEVSPVEANQTPIEAIENDLQHEQA